MKQSLALAIALLGDPPILVLDEVTASLDALGRHEFVGLLRQLTGSGRTLLFASHRLEEVRSLARRVAVLERGRLLRIDDCACFAPDAQHAAVLHLHLSTDERMPAIRALAAGGFSPTLNGTGILVPVASEHKAAPFRILVDGQSIERFAADAERCLGELAGDLKEGRYRAAPVRRVEIPKAGGQPRPQGIPTVKDRNVQAADKRVIEPIFEKEFLPTSYGFRPGRGGKDALREVDEWLKKGYTHVVDADLNSYFDSIPHARLKERLKRASAG